jgi:hypothetical protein
VNLRQEPGPEEFGELAGIPAVGLHSRAGTNGGERGRDDRAGHAGRRQLAMKRVPGRARFVAGAHRPRRLPLKPPRQPVVFPRFDAHRDKLADWPAGGASWVRSDAASHVSSSSRR